MHLILRYILSSLSRRIRRLLSPMLPSLAEPTHLGSCHCQAVVFSVKMGDPTRGSSYMSLICGCSYCAKKGIVWGLAGMEEIELVKGKEEITEYSYGNEGYNYFFCRKCSTLVGAVRKPYHTFGPPASFNAFNILPISSFDPSKVIPKTSVFPGISHDPPYIPAEPCEDGMLRELLAGEGGGGGQILHGACHCKRVRFAVLVDGKLGSDDVKLVDCNCSLCGGNGTTWLYPTSNSYWTLSVSNTTIFSPTTLTPLSSPQGLSSYDPPTHSASTNTYRFCSTCGCMVYASPRISSSSANEEGVFAAGVKLNAMLLDDVPLEGKRAKERGVWETVKAKATKQDGRSVGAAAVVRA